MHLKFARLSMFVELSDYKNICNWCENYFQPLKIRQILPKSTLREFNLSPLFYVHIIVIKLIEGGMGIFVRLFARFILLLSPKRFNESAQIFLLLFFHFLKEMLLKCIKCCISWDFWLTIIMTLRSKLIAPQFLCAHHIMSVYSWGYFAN